MLSNHTHTIPTMNEESDLESEDSRIYRDKVKVKCMKMKIDYVEICTRQHLKQCG